MERVVILGALSSFQIFHQCSTNNLWLSHYFRGIHLSLLATSFPAGKLLGTVIVPMASRRSGLERTLLLDAFLLTAGSLLSIIPRWWSLCVGRALIGIGSGIGFVTCTVILHATTISENRPSAYFIFAILYSSALLLANLIPPFGLLSYPLMSLLTALPAFIPGTLRSEQQDLSSLPALPKQALYHQANAGDFHFLAWRIIRSAEGYTRIGRVYTVSNWDVHFHPIFFMFLRKHPEGLSKSVKLDSLRYKISHLTGALYLLARISAPSTEFVNAEENASPKQQRPIKFCYLLMALNAVSSDYLSIFLKKKSEDIQK
ncbi:unnamed protein product [Toxocara canis]|uniref:MFS domain-containing protein n=1 Tax=Toxocara canis TaxID=6265 RepID=A0A183UGZ9_TOXCA|nr:unnamed protein product [Toxocara canis]